VVFLGDVNQRKAGVQNTQFIITELHLINILPSIANSLNGHRPIKWIGQGKFVKGAYVLARIYSTEYDVGWDDFIIVGRVVAQAKTDDGLIDLLGILESLKV